ncbi:MAG: DUF4435 domain-containing protein, partial [Campylobacterota bacterium]|nr:DUF4435 domain-containing protein [Campylobacterota bacterium]
NEIERRRQHTPVYRDGQLVYFIDKDFDDLIKQEKFKGLQEIENLYITPTYSIENFYTTLEVFQRILKSEFHLIETESDFEKLTELFLERQNEFHHIMLNVNAWIATQNYFSYTQEERNIPYNELSIDRFVKITLEKIEVKEDNMMEFLENRFQESYKMEDSEVSIKFQELKAKLFQNTQANFRGKFELEFLKKFLTRLIEKCNQKDGCGLKFIGINQKIKVQLILSDTISNLSQYADTPQCLRQFIKDNSMERI